jgi:hypothetical protein
MQSIVRAGRSVFCRSSKLAFSMVLRQETVKGKRRTVEALYECHSAYLKEGNCSICPPDKVVFS